MWYKGSYLLRVNHNDDDDNDGADDDDDDDDDIECYEVNPLAAVANKSTKKKFVYLARIAGKSTCSIRLLCHRWPINRSN